MFKILFALLLLVVSSNALQEMGLKGGSCTLMQKQELIVGFKAYKTPLKIGVGGTFDTVVYTPKSLSGNNFRDLFVGATVVIDTKSVNSKNRGRDDKLVKFFFENMTTGTITAKILEYKPNKRFQGKPKTGIFEVEITMNSITKIVPMRYSFFKGKMQADGVIDLFDFQASKSLQAINQACYKLHAGKTWSDVSISFTTEVKATLCNP